MKKLLSILMVYFLSCFNCLTALGTIVHDPQNLLQAAKHYSKEVAHFQEQMNQWKQTAEHFKEQHNMMKRQLASNTGERDIGDVDGELSSLSQELNGIEKHRRLLNNLLRSSDSQQNEDANEILEKYHIFDVCKEKGSRKLDNICKEELLNKAGTIEVGEQIREKMKNKMVEASKLASKAKTTKDTKESQDLANAIALKDMEINQLKNQWDSFVDESNLREKLIEEKRREAFWEHQKNAPIPTFK